MRRSFPDQASAIGAGMRGVAMALLLATAVSCGGGGGSVTQTQQPADTAPAIMPDEVNAIMQLASRAIDSDLVVAVTDRQARILGVAANFPIDRNSCKAAACSTAGAQQCGAPVCSTVSSDCATVNLASQLARTAGLFSADQIFLTSRAVRFISDPNFPPGVRNTGAGGLFSIEATNRGCRLDARNPLSADFNPGKFYPPQLNIASLLRELDGEAPLRCENSDEPNTRCGCNTGIATLPGGVPVYKNGRLVGGIGVAIRGVSYQTLPVDPVANPDNPNGLRKDDSNPNLALGEFAARAFAGDQVAIENVKPKGLKNVCDTDVAPACCFDPKPCFISIAPVPPPAPFNAVVFLEGLALPFVDFSPQTPPNPGSYPGLTTFLVDPRQGNVAPDGWIVGPKDATDNPPGAAPLTAAEVQSIVENAVAEAQKARSAVRLPDGTAVAVVHAITDTNGELIGLFRQPDALPDAIDVCPAKARTSVYASSQNINPLDTLDNPAVGVVLGEAFPPGTAISGRALGFGGQPFFPSGINGTTPGPFRVSFNKDQELACTLLREPTNGRQNGAIFFPGGVPLYRNGVLVGGLGVSGDGGEQNDLVASAGTAGFEAPDQIRADQLVLRKNEGDGVRLPYLKFNRRPLDP
jgi:uncharacterized protein GlcG (DUF336 family)